MRVLITGASGFVAPYAARAFRTCVPNVELVAATRAGETASGFDEKVALDITSPADIQSVLAFVRPTHVLHLAGVAAPQAASADPDLAWHTNTLGALTLGRMLLSVLPETILLNAGSGSAYGDSATRSEEIDEDMAFLPGDEYGVTKAAADLGLAVLAKRGLKVLRFRPFNHTGPGQTQDYVIPAFAAQIASIERGDLEPVIKVGNLEAERDFCDVADIADAYVRAAILASEGKLAPGRAYNLCSGLGKTVRSVLDELLAMSEARIEVRQDAARMRPSDIPRMVGNARRAEAELGWRAVTPLSSTLRTTLDYWRERVPLR